MTAAAWISLAIAVLSVIGSTLGAWMAVRAAQARDGQRILALEQEVMRLRDSLHSLRTEIAPWVVYAQLFKERLDKN